MIEIFKTNVQEFSRAEEIVEILMHHFPGSKINFDLDDCDKILRVEGDNFAPQKIMVLVKKNGFKCNVLD